MGVESFSSRTAEEIDDDGRPLDGLPTVSPDVVWAPSRRELLAPPQTVGVGATLHVSAPTPSVLPGVWHVLSPAMPPGPLPGTALTGAAATTC